MLLLLPQRYVFSSKSQHAMFRQSNFLGCCCYHKGTYFQANHNMLPYMLINRLVVVATTKVRIFKQITTYALSTQQLRLLLLLPQRYVFSSKSQQALKNLPIATVVVATTKVRIFKQITTKLITDANKRLLLLLPQRYVFSSKSQLLLS